MMIITVYVAIGFVLTMTLLLTGTISEIAEETSEEEPMLTRQQWIFVFSSIYFLLWPIILWLVIKECYKD